MVRLKLLLRHELVWQRSAWTREHERWLAGAHMEGAWGLLEVPLRTGGPVPPGTDAIRPPAPDYTPTAEMPLADRPLWTHDQRLREETERLQRRISGLNE